MRLKLSREWVLGSRIDGGGFGQVYNATCPDPDIGPSVAKLVPKAPGAQREMLFVNLAGIRNVVPIIDSGETEDSWALVMPRADKSLRQHMREGSGAFDLDSALPILMDITTALADLDGKVVHRDLKPENILLLNGTWCLADFGISRYAEATTAPDTQKYALSAPYAAPERWRGERATGATDIYSLGVIAFELLSGALPFSGSDISEYREKHLHAEPGVPSNAPRMLAALISECLYKTVGARPGPQNVLARLKAVAERAPIAGGRARLQQANMQEVARQSEAVRMESAGRSETERRQDLFRDASTAFRQIGEKLKSAVMENAPAAVLNTGMNGSWSIRLNQAELILSTVVATSVAPWEGRQPPRLDVIAHASIRVQFPMNRFRYEGRSHSLWFCDAKEVGRYGWFETAFMLHPLTSKSSSMAPFAADPGKEAGGALSPGMGGFQSAWPFTPLTISDLNDFVDRWLGWLADAAQGRLNIPSSMPERPSEWQR